MALIGDSGLSGLLQNPASQPNQPSSRDTENTGSGGTARGGNSARGEGVVVDLSPEGRAAVRASADAVSSSPADSGVSERAAEEARAEAADSERAADDRRTEDRRDAERADDRRAEDRRDDDRAEARRDEDARDERRERVDLRA